MARTCGHPALPRQGTVSTGDPEPQARPRPPTRRSGPPKLEAAALGRLRNRRRPKRRPGSLEARFVPRAGIVPADLAPGPCRTPCPCPALKLSGQRGVADPCKQLSVGRDAFRHVRTEVARQVIPGHAYPGLRVPRGREKPFTRSGHLPQAERRRQVSELFDQPVCLLRAVLAGCPPGGELAGFLVCFPSFPRRRVEVEEQQPADRGVESQPGPAGRRLNQGEPPERSPQVLPGFPRRCPRPRLNASCKAGSLSRWCRRWAMVKNLYRTRNLTAVRTASRCSSGGASTPRGNRLRAASSVPVT